MYKLCLKINELNFCKYFEKSLYLFFEINFVKLQSNPPLDTIYL